MAAVVGAVVLLGSGCDDPAPAKADKPAVAAPTPATSPPPVMPDLVGQKFTDAEAAVKKQVTTPVEARSAYTDVTLAGDRAQWTVCFQTPAAQSPLPPSTAVELTLVAPGTACPAKAGAALQPSKSPAVSSPPKPATSPPATDGSSSGGGSSTGSSGGGSTGGGSSSVSFKSCAEARAAGAAPMRRGEPGYSRSLDRDNDGIACDK
ncbi:excalibur calcium-binding domain-containing protein [Streptomyces sp. NPDC032472]|uniref:excalibur calcium-binding domain-containing protein n=1 Tax=Streptomyces sp. NPDC032472 TaxID=3155018 RepID=UPI0033EF87CB